MLETGETKCKNVCNLNNFPLFITILSISVHFKSLYVCSKFSLKGFPLRCIQRMMNIILNTFIV